MERKHEYIPHMSPSVGLKQVFSCSKMLKIVIVSTVQQQRFGEQHRGFSINETNKKKKHISQSNVLKTKCAAQPNVKVGERLRGRSVGVLLQRNVIYNSQPYVNTFISALMNWFLRFERKCASVWRSPSSARRKAISWHVNLKCDWVWPWRWHFHSLL